ncbi:hypothetical protein KKHLCK_06000 [Candidatus Electrothrix laxa]
MHGLVDFITISRKFNCLWCEKKNEIQIYSSVFCLSQSDVYM